jgi:hypothetical protein
MECERAACSSGRFVQTTGEPEHFAQIGMQDRHTGSKFGRPAKMRDCLVAPAVLVGDDAEQMLGFVRSGLHFEYAAAECIGGRQAAFAAMALGKAQGLGGRYGFRRHFNRIEPLISASSNASLSSGAPARSEARWRRIVCLT